MLRKIPMNDLRRFRAGSMFSARISTVLDSGEFILGSEVKAFEAELSRFLGVKRAAAVGNGTDAIQLGLRALGVQPGDVVATTPNAGGYTTTALRRIGAKPLFIDVDDDGQMSPEDLRRKLRANPLTKVVVATHLFGLMGRIFEIKEIAEGYGVQLFEDCAQAIGAKLNGHHAGAIGHAASFSFYPTKNLGGFGDSGAVVSSSGKVVERVELLRQYGWSTRYEVAEDGGMNSRMDEIQAAILVDKLQSIDQVNSRRREIWGKFCKATQRSRWRLIGSNSESFVAHLAVLVAPSRIEREAAQELFASNGVSTSVHYPILDYHQSAWRAEYMEQNCPKAEDLTDRILSVPLFPELEDWEVDSISKVISDLGSL